MSDIITPQQMETLWSLRVGQWAHLSAEAEHGQPKNSQLQRSDREAAVRIQYAAFEAAESGQRQVVVRVLRILIDGCANSIKAQWSRNSHYLPDDHTDIGDRATHETLVSFYSGRIRGVAPDGHFSERCASTLVKYALGTARRLIERVILQRQRRSTYPPPPAPPGLGDASGEQALLERNAYAVLDRLYVANDRFRENVDALVFIARAGGCTELERKTGRNRGTCHREKVDAAFNITRMTKAVDVGPHDTCEWLIKRCAD